MYLIDLDWVISSNDEFWELSLDHSQSRSTEDSLNVPPIIIDENRYIDQKGKAHNSLKISSFAGHRLQCSDARESLAMKYQNIINYPRVVSPRNSNAPEHCVMCGQHDIPIPAQNKSICKPCDSSYWLVRRHDIVVKFCKGCKNFLTLNEFQEKPEASKCGRCRQRGRNNYFLKKSSSSLLCSSSSDEEREYQVAAPSTMVVTPRGIPSTPFSTTTTPPDQLPRKPLMPIATPNHLFDSSGYSFTPGLSGSGASSSTTAPLSQSSTDMMDDLDTPRIKTVRFLLDEKLAMEDCMKESAADGLKLDDVTDVSPIAVADACSDWSWDPTFSPLTNLASLTRVLFINQEQTPATNVASSSRASSNICGKRSRSIL